MKVNNSFKIVLTFFSFITLLTNCENDVNIIDETKVSESSIPSVKTIVDNNVGATFNRLKNDFKLDPFLKLTRQSNELGRPTEEVSGLTIYTDVVKEVTLGNYTSYTMRIAVPNSDDSKFYNLTIEDKNGVSDMFVTKYIPTQNWLNDTKKPFEGSFSSMRGGDLTIEGDNFGDEYTG
jgi:hypothetical protein